MTHQRTFDVRATYIFSFVSYYLYCLHISTHFSTVIPPPQTPNQEEIDKFSAFLIGICDENGDGELDMHELMKVMCPYLNKQ